MDALDNASSSGGVGDGKPAIDHIQPSMLTTEPTAVAALDTVPGGASAENIIEGENSLFDNKGLIDINTARTMNDQPPQMPLRQSTEFDESLHQNASVHLRQQLNKEQEHMQSSAGEGGAWSPSEQRAGAKLPSYFGSQGGAVDGIIGKLGRLEAMILSQKNSKKQTKKEAPTQKLPFPVKTTTIDRIIYPVYTKKGLKYGKPKKNRLALDAVALPEPEPVGKLLDGFLILYSCRVKLPHEAIKSRLASQRIVEVIEEDLCYFQNLNAIDLSDNKVRLEQLKNLKSLVDVNLQYNNVQIIPPLLREDFPKLETLNLSYNQLTPASIRHLYLLPRLKVLDLQGNNLVTLPEDLKELRSLEELNLSSNLLSTHSTLINPAILMKVLGQMTRLKRLNLSRNKLQGLHFDLLNAEEDFALLQELDIGYNLVQSEDDIWYATQMKSLQILVITGNPFALTGKQAYQRLEEAVAKNLSATVINEDVPEQRSYLRKPGKQQRQAFPYPNPIKLFSRSGENSKEIKGEYLNAELMNQGVALQIAEIRPDTNIEQEIFPRELTRDAQEKEIFTPPNHKQMRFLKSGGQKQAQQQQDGFSSQNADSENQFFITENILPDQPGGDSKIIHEERSQQESEGVTPDGGEFDNDEQELEEEDMDQEEAVVNDANFDFGRAKMDYFKQRARDILMQENDIEYAGTAMQLGMCFKSLKNALRNPVIVHGGEETKPHYLKMTFSTCRAAMHGDRYLEMSRLIGSDGSLLRQDPLQSQSSLVLGSRLGISKIPPLMRAGKELQAEQESLLMLGSVTTAKKKSKKEEMIDKKIEYLLETYKKQDEELLKKAGEKSAKRQQDKKRLRDKFGFSDDEEEIQDDNESSIMEKRSTAKLEPMATTGKFNQSGSINKAATNKKLAAF